MNNIFLFFLILSITFGLTGWIIHLYTILLSAKSTPEKWSIRVKFNDYHEAIPEVIIMSIIIIINTITLIYLPMVI